jgi:hypothetical protein
MEIERLELTSIDYQDLLESTRQKAILALNKRRMDKEKLRDVNDVLRNTDERLRLAQGKSTANVSIAGIIAEIEQADAEMAKNKGIIEQNADIDIPD